MYIFASRQAMDAILATVANGGQAPVDINREAGRNKIISHFIYYLILNPSTSALANPFCRGPWGWGMFSHKKSCCWQGKGLHHGGDVCVLCDVLLAKSHRQELFIPTRTDLAVELLMHIKGIKRILQVHSSSVSIYVVTKVLRPHFYSYPLMPTMMVTGVLQVRAPKRFCINFSLSLRPKQVG